MPVVTQNPETTSFEALQTVWMEDGEISLPVDPFVIARKLGIQTYVANLPEKVSGIFRAKPGSDPKIYINTLDHANRQRFTCAHELGHYYLMVAEGRTDEEIVERRDLFSTTGQDEREVYANQFAAGLLMPKEKLKEMRAEKSPATLAYEFGVSPDAMAFRLKNIGA
jgi:Zn-dependent peptidase ImmA (M78 family)